MDILFESILYLVAYLVDWLRWWRLMVCVVVSIAGAFVCYHAAFHSHNVYQPLLPLGIPVLGAVTGFVWEYRTRRP